MFFFTGKRDRFLSFSERVKKILTLIKSFYSTPPLFSNPSKHIYKGGLRIILQKHSSGMELLTMYNFKDFLLLVPPITYRRRNGRRDGCTFDEL